MKRDFGGRAGFISFPCVSFTARYFKGLAKNELKKLKNHFPQEVSINKYLSRRLKIRELPVAFIVVILSN